MIANLRCSYQRSCSCHGSADAAYIRSKYASGSRAVIGAPREPSELGEVALGVALPHVDGQVGDPARVPGILASGPGPRARPVRVIASSTAVSTTARVRRAISSARPSRFNGSAST